MKVTLRAYEPPDREEVRGVFRSNVPDFFRADEEAAFLSFVDGGEQRYFVLESGGRIVGCGGFGTDRVPRIADLCWGMIARESQGRGLGRHLALGRLARMAELPDIDEIRLVTGSRTEAFYARLGFRTITVEPDGIAPGMDSVVMGLPLTPAVRESLVRAWRRIVR